MQAKGTRRKNAVGNRLEGHFKWRKLHLHEPENRVGTAHKVSLWDHELFSLDGTWSTERDEEQ